jgi:hypothetical protein
MIQDEADIAVPVFAELNRLEASLSSTSVNHDMRENITRRLRTMLSQWIETQNVMEPESAAIEFQSATPDEVFDFLDKELGSP